MAKPYVQKPPRRSLLSNIFGKKPDEPQPLQSSELTGAAAPTPESEERNKAMRDRWYDMYGKEVKKQ